MDASHCIVAFNFPCKEGTRNLVLCVQFEGRHQCECHNVNNKGCIDALKSSSDLTYTCKEGYETLHQQYIPLLTVYCRVSHTGRVLYHESGTILCAIRELNSIEMT